MLGREEARLVAHTSYLSTTLPFLLGAENSSIPTQIHPWNSVCGRHQSARSMSNSNT